MGCNQGIPHHNAPPRTPVPNNKTRICVSGFKVSHHTGRARKIAALIASKYPDKYETWFYFDSSDCWRFFLKETFDTITFPEHLKGHSTSPFVWFERENDVIEPIGGRSNLAEWALKQFQEDKEIIECASVDWSFGDLFHNSNGLEPTAK
jgi:hypothetical protein